MLTCLDAATGTRKWRSETKGKAVGYQDGQILLIGDKILVSSEDGYLALVLADPDQFTELGRVKVFKDRTWNCPAIAHGEPLFAITSRWHALTCGISLRRKARHNKWKLRSRTRFHVRIV